MKYIKILLILLVVWQVTNQYNAYADNRIVVYLRHAPPDIIKQTIASMDNDNLIKNIQSVKNFQSEALKNKFKKILTPKLSGFVAIYGGYIDISNKDGIIQFPLRQSSKKLYIAFSEKIKLIRVKENTFSHREFADPKKVKTALYVYEKKIDKNNNYYWNVKEEKIPADRKISPLTLVIFTNPENVFIRTGDFLSNESQHFVLPDIYVINSLHQGMTTLGTLRLKRFFEPVKFEEKPSTEKSTQGLLNNT